MVELLFLLGGVSSNQSQSQHSALHSGEYVEGNSADGEAVFQSGNQHSANQGAQSVGLLSAAHRTADEHGRQRLHEVVVAAHNLSGAAAGGNQNAADGYEHSSDHTSQVEIIEGHMMIDHVHLLLSIPPKMSVSSLMGYLKGKSALMIFDNHANLKYKYGNHKFWAEGYYVSTVGLNESTIKNYIAEQDKHDIALDKLSVKEYEDPFKGGK